MNLHSGRSRINNRPWPDQTHFPFQHIPQLRQFIETGLAQEAAHRVTRGSFFSL